MYYTLKLHVKYIPCKKNQIEIVIHYNSNSSGIVYLKIRKDIQIDNSISHNYQNYLFLF